MVEKVLIGEPGSEAGAEFEAKLDTGAATSSVDAIEISPEDRSGRKWLSFTVVRVDGQRIRLSGPLVRHVRIKRVGGATSERPVVRLQICLGSVSRSVDVSLADRIGFDYDVLIGRNFLNGYFMIDPVRDHALTLACPAGRPK